MVVVKHKQKHLQQMRQQTYTAFQRLTALLIPNLVSNLKLTAWSIFVNTFPGTIFTQANIILFPITIPDFFTIFETEAPAKVAYTNVCTWSLFNL